MSSRIIHPERQVDAIRFSRLQAQNTGLRDSRERYVQDWIFRTPEEIRAEINRIRRRVDDNLGGPAEGDLLGESWRVAALHMALQISNDKQSR